MVEGIDTALGDELRFPIRDEADIVTARQEGRALALRQGLTSSDATLVATAISELARNIVQYAREGAIILRPVRDGRVSGIQLEALDEGPGLPDVERALEPGFSTGGGLGLGLPGVRRLMDTFEVQSAPERGTRVIVSKWSLS